MWKPRKQVEKASEVFKKFQESHDKFNEVLKRSHEEIDYKEKLAGALEKHGQTLIQGKIPSEWAFEDFSLDKKALEKIPGEHLDEYALVIDPEQLAKHVDFHSDLRSYDETPASIEIAKKWNTLRIGREPSTAIPLSTLWGLLEPGIDQVRPATHTGKGLAFQSEVNTSEGRRLVTYSFNTNAILSQIEEGKINSKQIKIPSKESLKIFLKSRHPNARTYITLKDIVSKKPEKRVQLIDLLKRGLAKK